MRFIRGYFGDTMIARAKYDEKEMLDVTFTFGTAVLLRGRQ